MCSIISVWVNDSQSFEHDIPLKWLGERMRSIGATQEIHLVFLEGLQRLAKNYVNDLKNLNYVLIDGSASYKDISKKFAVLERFGDYEKKCFLRWLVIREIFETTPVIHYDGDIVFNELPEIIEKYFGSRAFVLQGCPAFVSTGGSEWLSEYQNQLGLFIKNIEKYSERAWKEREGFEFSYSTKWAGCRFRKIISSDQDLISHLIHTDQLPQQIPSHILAETGLLLFENPLYFFSHYPELLPIQYKRVAGIDYFNCRKIGFWHMQSDFINYLRFFLQRGLLNKLTRCFNPLEKKNAETLFWRFYNSFAPRKLNRLTLYKYFFELNDFSEIFNNRAFWKPGVFK